MGQTVTARQGNNNLNPTPAATQKRHGDSHGEQLRCEQGTELLEVNRRRRLNLKNVFWVRLFASVVPKVQSAPTLRTIEETALQGGFFVSGYVSYAPPDPLGKILLGSSRLPDAKTYTFEPFTLPPPALILCTWYASDMHPSSPGKHGRPAISPRERRQPAVLK